MERTRANPRVTDVSSAKKKESLATRGRKAWMKENENLLSFFFPPSFHSWLRWNCVCVPMKVCVCTVIGARVYFSFLVFDPRVNLDEFGDEARYVTLDNCGVPPKDVFVHHVHCIPLPDNCNQTPVSGFTISRTSTYSLVSVMRSIVAMSVR